MQSTSTETAPLWLLIMRRYDGLRELVDGKLNPIVRGFFKFTRFPEDKVNAKTSWCAALASACVETAGLRGPHSAAAIAFEEYGTNCDPGKPGAILVFKRTDPANKNARHVGFSEGWVAGLEGKAVRLRAGNQGNKCCVVVRDDMHNLTSSKWPSGVTSDGKPGG